MKYLLISLLVSFSLINNINAQKNMDGEYMLRGIHDMASGFRFSKDGTFDFFYVYGAVDRNATGTYTLDGDTIKLHSSKEPGKDFPITKQEKKGKGYTIRLTAPNKYLLQNVTCIYFSGDTKEYAESDSEGVIHFDAPACDTIYLLHQLFADIPSLIKDKDNQNNYFEVSLSPTLQQVSFKGIDFILKGREITCLPNYFMPFDNIKYGKD
jgi:hypothetical protein